MEAKTVLLMASLKLTEQDMFMFLWKYLMTFICFYFIFPYWFTVLLCVYPHQQEPRQTVHNGDHCLGYHAGLLYVTFWFHLLADPTLVVDGMACLCYWYSCKDWACGGQWREYLDILKRWVEAFTSAGIRLVFFFDGVVEEQKRQEWVRT